ncbi:MAG: deoxyguanosinetriphosphate triphosphohydrolase [Clostridia bacterium]|nr:deoxyguanosinetriphosphate triphosphohydrolase [Clostridia bacterium]MBQ4575062.1 deoxyguanosinetriphosphate triphosphohydrolase [Clostridia bacterium]
MSTIRDMLHQRERETLSEYAVFSEDSQGRDFPVSPDDVRTDFQRDRDRIIHSKAFRRLMHKTQVFLSPEADHYRTRLTHTLEVTQIARTIARSLRLNEDLCEAIGLGHDLGHTPFGHAGERVLQRCYDENFAHYKQSLRVVEKLENLNLTWEVRNGIVTHTGEEVASTLEGKIIKFADRIAYINHDIDDACRAGILQDDDIPLDLRRKLGASHGARIDTMVRSIIRASEGKPEIIMEDDVYKATMSLREFLFEMVYKSPIAKGQEGKAECMLEQLYTYFLEHTEALPGEYKWMLRDEEPGRIVCDYISGMTDRYAINLYRSLFIPEVWSGGVLR